MQLSALNDFSWDSLASSVGNIVGKAADVALQYKQAQLAADTAKAQAQAAAQTAIAKATLQNGQSSMFNYGYGNSTRGAALPQIMPPVSSGTNYMPLLLIGGFGIAAVLLLMRR